MSEERTLRDEIDAALEGMNLQDLDLPAVSKKAPTDAGSRVSRGTVVGVNRDDVIVELGPRVQGVISVAEFTEPPKVGDTFDFTIVGREDDLWLLSRREAVSLAALEDLEPGVRIKAKVTGQNTGGLELRFSGVAGFMPASHVDVARIEDLSAFIGQHVVCEVLEIDRSKKRLLLSRRNVLQKEVDLARSETVRTLSPGDVVHGKVTRVESFGAFVDIGSGVEGLVHVSNIARERVNDANDLLKVGQEVHAKVVEIKEGGKRIGLSIKQLLPDPWDDAEERYQQDQIIQARVVKAMEFGLFMEIEPGLEGLLHVSQMGEARRGGRRKDGPAIGSQLAVRIVSVDRSARRIGLSRLDSHGALIGSEEAAGAAEIDDVLRGGRENLGTNLGNLFKKALGGE